MQQFDVLVIGAGAAGLTAAITAGRRGLAVAVLDRLGPGGQAMTAPSIENWPGAPDPIAGADLGSRLFEQASAAGAEIMLETVTGLRPDGSMFIVDGVEDRYRARAVIIAAGSSPRALPIPGAARYFGRGVSHCAICDGPLYRGKPVAVVGGGDSALDAALHLADLDCDVTVYQSGGALSAQRTLIDRAARHRKIAVRLGTTVVRVSGTESVDGIHVRASPADPLSIVPTVAVFVAIGLDPNTAFVRDLLALDATGHVVTDLMMRTSVHGIYAAGDIRAASVALFAASAGDGATAAMAVWLDLTATSISP